jgi:hypothetical protein
MLTALLQRTMPLALTAAIVGAAFAVAFWS